MTRTYEALRDDVDVQPVLTAMLQRVVQYAQLHAQSSGRTEGDTGQMLAEIYQAERAQAVYLLRSQGVNKLDVLSYLSHGVARGGAASPRYGGADPAMAPSADEAEVGDAPAGVRGDPLKSF